MAEFTWVSGMICTICQHPKREEIAVALLRDGTRDTARRFAISRSALDRHKKHLPRELVKAQEAQEVASATSVLSQLSELVSDCKIIAAKAKAARQWSSATAALREVRSTLELLARLELMLQQARPQPAAFRARTVTDQELTTTIERVRQKIRLRQSLALAGESGLDYGEGRRGLDYRTQGQTPVFRLCGKFASAIEEAGGEHQER